jgi:hypothetical protein
MSNLTIKKATLTSGHGLSLELSEKQKDGSYVDSKSEYSAAVHNDLKESFRRMGVHLALASEYVTSDDIEDIDKPDEDLVKPFTVNSITFLPDDSGVKISGSVELSTEKKMSLSPPAIKWEDDPGYEYSSELAEIAELCKQEIQAYLKGKHAPEPQQELPFVEDAEDAM